jgi:hypothetical protein
MSEKQRISMSVRAEGVDATLRAYKKLDKDAQKKAKDKTKEVSEMLAKRIRGSAPADPRYSALAQSVKAGRDRVPVVRIGGRATPQVSGGGGPRELVIGMEFGADRNGPNAWRFPPRTPKRGRGNAGYWIFPTAVREQTSIVKLWQDSLDPVLNDWAN